MLLPPHIKIKRSSPDVSQCLHPEIVPGGRHLEIATHQGLDLYEESLEPPFGRRELTRP